LQELVQTIYSTFKASLPGSICDQPKNSSSGTTSSEELLDFDPAVTILDSSGSSSAESSSSGSGSFIVEEPNDSESKDSDELGGANHAGYRFDNVNFERLGLTNFDFGPVECEVGGTRKSYGHSRLGVPDIHLQHPSLNSFFCIVSCTKVVELSALDLPLADDGYFQSGGHLPLVQGLLGRGQQGLRPEEKYDME
jgi:hypothetical protein